MAIQGGCTFSDNPNSPADSGAGHVPDATVDAGPTVPRAPVGGYGYGYGYGCETDEGAYGDYGYNAYGVYGYGDGYGAYGYGYDGYGAYGYGYGYADYGYGYGYGCSH